MVDRNFLVEKTNYYNLNNTSEGQVLRRVGELLRCKNGLDAGACGSHENCKVCPVRNSIEKCFREKGHFSPLETPMRLYMSEKMDNYVDCIVCVSGTYLQLDQDDKVLLTVRDVTRQKKILDELEEARRNAELAGEQKTAFLANMSHEIRTPLNAIVGFSEIMALTENEEEKHEYLEIIQKNSNLLLQLINDILDLSRIESGKSEMHFQQVEIAGLVDEVEKVHQLKMKLNVDLKVVRPQGEFWTSTDRNRVMQVLFNFLSNAIKNTETGSITLGLKQEGDWLKLFVSDTGCGIPEEKLPQIFTRFEKLNDFVQGTGLGLSICKSIVERLGGRIEVSSELGKGSTFALYLPYQEIPVEVAERSLSTKIDSESVRHKKILVVEDIESNFAQLNILLKKEYTILWVRNGQEAINSFIREKPDLILMDIRMPVMDGIQATEKIRTISLSVPIIAVTAYAFYTEQQQAIQAGCNAVISKPYSLEKLKETIETYIG